MRFIVGLSLTVALMASGPGKERQTARAQVTGQVYFLVEDTDGAPVTDLTPEDFVIAQGDEEHEIISAEQLGGPLRLALLLDDSGGMTGYLNHVRNGLPRFLDALPDGSQIAVITLGQRPTTIVDYTTDMASVRERLADYFVQNDTSATFLDALVETVDALQAENARWPVIAAIIGDGAERSSSQQEAIQNMMTQLSEMGATFHSLTLASQGGGVQPEDARKVTEWTSGWNDVLNSPSGAAADKIAEMGEVVAQRYADVANQYVVVYEADAPPAAGFAAAVRRRGFSVRVSLDGRPPQ